MFRKRARETVRNEHDIPAIMFRKTVKETVRNEHDIPVNYVQEESKRDCKE